MFDTTMIGKRIKQARIDKNMTQMNLADAMGVSYQAVSNWERGNSMPDISKLGDLCSALDISVNALLGLEETVPNAVTKAMDNEPLSMEELAEVAPMLPPEEVKERVESESWFGPDMSFLHGDPAAEEQTGEHTENTGRKIKVFLKGMKEIVEKAETEKKQKQRKKIKKLDLSRIAELAPFLDQAYLDELIGEADLSDLDGLEDVAPFLSNATLEKLVDRAPMEEMDEIVEIAPFLNDAVLDKLVTRCAEAGNGEILEELAPFASSETLNKMVEWAITKKVDLDPEELYPFLSADTLRKLANYLMENRDLDALEDLVPFL